MVQMSDILQIHVLIFRNAAGNYFRECDLLLVDALAPRGYHVYKHMSYEEACQMATDLNAGDFRCVHMSHAISWDHPHIGKDGECFSFD